MKRGIVRNAITNRPRVEASLARRAGPPVSSGAAFDVRFTATSGVAVPIVLRITGVDNMRESVNSRGLIVGAAAMFLIP